MQSDHQTWYSPHLQQDMALNIYGHAGKPVLVFPTQGGRFHEYEDFGMLEALHAYIDAGRIQLFTVDSIDNQSWANSLLPPEARARRHEAYDSYIVHEVTPFIHQHAGQHSILATGCGLGAYHSANFFFRHPDIFDALLALSGLYQLRLLIGNAMSDEIYFNSPLLYLPGLNDPWYLERFRRSRIVIACGQGAWEDETLADTRAMGTLLTHKSIPAWVDIWGPDVNHDWVWWRKMAPYFMQHLLS